MLSELSHSNDTFLFTRVGIADFSSDFLAVVDDTMSNRCMVPLLFICEFPRNEILKIISFGLFEMQEREGGRQRVKSSSRLWITIESSILMKGNLMPKRMKGERKVVVRYE